MMLGHNITQLHNSRSHRDIKIRSHRDTKKYMSWAEQGHTQIFFTFLLKMVSFIIVLTL